MRKFEKENMWLAALLENKRSKYGSRSKGKWKKVNKINKRKKETKKEGEGKTSSPSDEKKCHVRVTTILR